MTSELNNPQVGFDLIHDRIRNLWENTDFVSTLFETLIGYAIIASDFDGNIIAYNKGSHQIYGYAPEEIIGKKNIEIFFPEEFVQTEELQRIINDLMGNDRFSYEGEKVRKNGERFPAQILFTLTKDNNARVVGFVEIVEDLTERKQAEETRQQMKLQRIQLEQLELERAEAQRNYEHLLAVSRGREQTHIKGVSHPDNDTLYGLTDEYRKIVLSYVRAVRIQEDRPSDRVRRFVQRLAGIHAGARDIVRLHLRVLEEFSGAVLPEEERAVSNDARLVLVDVMGSLIDIYRKLNRESQ